MPKTFGFADQQSVDRVFAATREVESSRPPPGRSSFAERMLNLLPIRLGKAASSISKGSSGTINVYWGTTKGSETNVGSQTISAYSRFGAVNSGNWVICLWLLGGWEIIQAEC